VTGEGDHINAMKKVGESRPFSRLACAAAHYMLSFIFPSAEKCFHLEGVSASRRDRRASLAASADSALAGNTLHRPLPDIAAGKYDA
jgi:hypothetical protein